MRGIKFAINLFFAPSALVELGGGLVKEQPSHDFADSAVCFWQEFRFTEVEAFSPGPDSPRLAMMVHVIDESAIHIKDEGLGCEAA